MDSLPLPPRPNLEQYKKRAKDLVKICESGNRTDLRAWVADWIETLVKLNDLGASTPSTGYRAYMPGEIGPGIERAVDRIAKHLAAGDQSPSGSCTLTKAQFALAREHGFASWEKFARHLEESARARSPISAFESAVDAIVRGDAAALQTLLSEFPSLVSARSMREHRSTLLHYVSANGIEDYRQKTPANIVEITQLLLDAGTDVNAESEAYGGRSTALGLTATSIHPEVAGVQLPLMELLITRGANIDPPDGGSIVNACLRNGRGQAAEYLAQHGARLSLEGAAGVGRLDLVRRFFDDDGNLQASAPEVQLRSGFAWACEFGRADVADFLSRAALKSEATPARNGEPTGLHWAAHMGHVDIVRLLIERSAPVDAREKRHNGMPLDWALHGWDDSVDKQDRGVYYELVALLVRAGARLDARWTKEGYIASKWQADPRMVAALRGQMPPP